MRRNHRFFKREREGQSQNDTSYDLRSEYLEHRDIVDCGRVVKHEYEGNEKSVRNYRRKRRKYGAAAQKISSHRADKRCERAQNHVEYTERREEKVGEKTTYRKPGDCFGEDERKQYENFGYAELHRTERYCAECYGQGKVQSGNDSRSCHINKRSFQNTPRFFLLMGIADTIESMVS